MPSEHAPPGARTWLWPLLRPHRGRIAVGAAALLVLTGVDLALPYLFKVAVDRAILPGRLGVLDGVAIACVVLVAAKLWASRIQQLAVAHVGQHTLNGVRRTLFGHLLRLSLAYYHRERTGGVVARMTGDVEALSGLVSSGLIQLVGSVVTVGGVAVVLVVLDWRLALATLTVAPVLAVAVAWFASRSRRAWGKVRQASSTVTSGLQETIGAVPEIRAYRQESAVLGRLGRAHEAARRANRRTTTQAALFFPGVELVSGIAVVIVLGYGGSRVLAGGLGIGTLTAFVLYLQVLFGPVFSLSEVLDRLQSAMAGADRIGRTLALPPAIREPVAPVPLARPRGDVRLAGVRFGYPDADGRTTTEVLHGIDLEIPAGTTVALVGATGAGKSTLARLVLRFHDPVAGRVLLDGHDLRDIRVDELRRAIGFVPQEGLLFAGTVADNIRFGRPDASHQDIGRAVAALGVGPVVDRLPAGLDTEVGERGDRLASGERQVVAFLRAWLADPAVLVLDEATSQLDPDTEACLHRALRRLRRHRATLVIAHRLATVLDADRVVVLDRGRVVESGPPTRLLSAGGPFARLYRQGARLG